jgi:hypothetical protein
METDGKDLCGFNRAWVGECTKKKPCKDHDKLTCWRCGSKATYDCPVAGSLTCGTPCCDNHPHEHTHY